MKEIHNANVRETTLVKFIRNFLNLKIKFFIINLLFIIISINKLQITSKYNEISKNNKNFKNYPKTSNKTKNTMNLYKNIKINKFIGSRFFRILERN